MLPRCFRDELILTFTHSYRKDYHGTKRSDRRFLGDDTTAAAHLRQKASLPLTMIHLDDFQVLTAATQSLIALISYGSSLGAFYDRCL